MTGRVSPENHTCPVPVDSRKHWWTCEVCGQLWHKVDGLWKLSPREVQA